MIDLTIPSFGPDDHLLGRYRLVNLLGQGGMGSVWLAHDTQLERDVAIKLLPTALSRDKRSIGRLKEEAKRNLDLTHPNIVRLYTFEQDPARGNAAFLVMQYVKGETLNDLLAEHPYGLPIDRVRRWFEQVATSIDFAHSKGILHRDIKPANIMIESGTAYLMDFGIASEIRDTMTRVTGAQDSSGTLPYMSPQQLMGKSDKSNDVYSFAATLYEALCGRPPFHTGDIAYQIRSVDPEAIPGLPDALNTALLASLHKDGAKRPSSCAAVLSDSHPVVHLARGPEVARSAVPRHLDRKTVEFAPGVMAEFVYIDAPGVAPDGFLMGSPATEEGRFEDEVQHRVKLAKGFWMQTTEVTQGQWEAVMGSNPSHFKNGANFPVESVSWADCQGFISKLRARGVAARLPTEAEWEFACRAGTTTPFSFGAPISTDLANYNGNRPNGSGRKGAHCEKTTPVGSFPANAWGLHDMHGNVWEWCEDWAGDFTSGGTATDPAGPEAGSYRVLRGGSWFNIPRYLRSARRHRHIPTGRSDIIGLRLSLGLHKDGAKRPLSCAGLLAAHEPTLPPVVQVARVAAVVPSAAPRHLARKTVEFAPGVVAEFVYIDAPGAAPEGFMMGSPTTEAKRNKDEAHHKVKLTRGFWIQTTEVTQEQWEAVTGNNPSKHKNCRNLPVESVRWTDCQKFIAKLRDRGLLARLPTEAEWEFACRAGTTTPFSFGSTISTDQANYCGSSTYGSRRKGLSRWQTTPVAAFSANEWGLYDMHGNVWEWCADPYESYPSVGTSIDPTGPARGGYRVVRGGSWSDSVERLRSASRDWYKASARHDDLGLRLSLDADP